jgi:hypothetical protein
VVGRGTAGPMPGGEPLLTVARLIAWSRGRFLALSKVRQQAAPGNVSPRELAGRCSIVRIKRRHYRSWRHQETFAGAACQSTLTTGKRNGLRTRVQLRTVKSSSLQAVAHSGAPQLIPSDFSLPICGGRASRGLRPEKTNPGRSRG